MNGSVTQFCRPQQLQLNNVQNLFLTLPFPLILYHGCCCWDCVSVGTVWPEMGMLGRKMSANTHIPFASPWKMPHHQCGTGLPAEKSCEPHCFKLSKLPASGEPAQELARMMGSEITPLWPCPFFTLFAWACTGSISGFGLTESRFRLDSGK